MSLKKYDQDASGVHLLDQPSVATTHPCQGCANPNDCGNDWVSSGGEPVYCDLCGAGTIEEA